MELTSILKSLCSCCTYAKFCLAILFILITGTMYRCIMGNTTGSQIGISSTTGIIPMVNACSHFLEFANYLFSKVYKNFLSIKRKKPSKMTNYMCVCVFVILFQIKYEWRRFQLTTSKLFEINMLCFRTFL